MNVAPYSRDPRQVDIGQVALGEVEVAEVQEAQDGAVPPFPAGHVGLMQVDGGRQFFLRHGGV